MTALFTLTVALSLVASGAPPACPKGAPSVRDEYRASDAVVIGAASPSFDGAQLKYTWRELEPERDRYDFSSIRHDLALLRRNGKRLFIQLQDVSFDASIINAPPYLLTDTAYHGGIAGQYGRDEDSTAKPQGYVARQWDPAVRERFHKVLAALGKEFDGEIEGINLPETSLEFGTSRALYPAGFTPTTYRDGVVDNLRALRRSFRSSVAMQYANFMPGEWLPGDDRGYLRSVYAEARQLALAMGGPDLLPHRRGQQNHTYAMLRAYRGVAPTGIAVQWGNYEDTNPQTGARTLSRSWSISPRTRSVSATSSGSHRSRSSAETCSDSFSEPDEALASSRAGRTMRPFPRATGLSARHWSQFMVGSAEAIGQNS